MSGGFDDEGPRWPERDVDRRPAREPDPPPEPSPPPQPMPPPTPIPPTETGEQTTSLGEAFTQPSDRDDDGWDPKRDGDRRRPTTAEQAVPWLIGLLLGLTGIVIVLLALIFIGPEGVALPPNASPTPSPSEQASVSTSFVPSPTVEPTPSPTATPAPPTFGALEMTFLGRAKAASPIRLSRRDFSTTASPTVIAEDPKGVEHYVWSPDGLSGAAIIAGRAVAVVSGKPLRTLIDPVDALTFADDSTTLYGVRVARAGANDRAEVLTIDFATGATAILATLTYPHPDIFPDPALKEAQFADNGGVVRLWATVDGYLVAWILGAPATYRIDPANGVFTQVAQQPTLWSPDRKTRVGVTEKSGISTLTLLDMAGTAKSSVKVTGLVSHIRWAGTNNEIVFTLGRLVGGGVRQDLYVWDLVNAKAPAPLTSNGASFGAEWLGVLQSWAPSPP